MTKYDPVARRKTARALKRSGKTYAEIGEIMGISRQRAQQLVRPAKKERFETVEAAQRIDLHFTLAPSTHQELSDLKDKTKIPMNRLIDGAINLYHAVRLAKRPVVCTPTATGIEISEVPQETNHD